MVKLEDTVLQLSFCTPCNYVIVTMVKLEDTILPRQKPEVFSSLCIEASLTLYTEYAALLVLFPPGTLFTCLRPQQHPSSRQEGPFLETRGASASCLLLRSCASVFDFLASSFLYLLVLLTVTLDVRVRNIAEYQPSHAIALVSSHTHVWQARAEQHQCAGNTVTGPGYSLGMKSTPRSMKKPSKGMKLNPRTMKPYPKGMKNTTKRMKTVPKRYEKYNTSNENDV